MPKIVPLVAVPTVRPDAVATTSILRLEPCEVLWVEGRVTAGSVSLRPYYFADEPSSVAAIKGAWIPLGGDAIAGTNPTSFDATLFDGCANGRYESRRAGYFVVLVEENAVGVAYDFIRVSAELASSAQ